MKCSEKVGKEPLKKWLNFYGDPIHRLDTGMVFRVRHYWGSIGRYWFARWEHWWDVRGGGLHSPSASSFIIGTFRWICCFTLVLSVTVHLWQCQSGRYSVHFRSILPAVEFIPIELAIVSCRKFSVPQKKYRAHWFFDNFLCLRLHSSSLTSSVLHQTFCCIIYVRLVWPYTNHSLSWLVDVALM